MKSNINFSNQFCIILAIKNHFRFHRNYIFNSKIDFFIFHKEKCLQTLGETNFRLVHRFLTRVYKSGRSGDPAVMEELREMVGIRVKIWTFFLKIYGIQKNNFWYFSKITLFRPLASQCMVVEELIMLQQQCGTNNWTLQFIPFFLRYSHIDLSHSWTYFFRIKIYFIKIVKVVFESLFAFF